MARIHPTAVVSAEAEIAGDAEVGPYAIIEGPVTLGPGTAVLAHTHVQGRTTVGRGCRLGPAAYVGLPPQHLRADPTVGSLVIGDEVTVREAASIHRAAVADDGSGAAGVTRVGDRCFIMSTAHVAHDCLLGAGVTMANGALLAGHCTVGDNAFLGGGAVLHQFCRVGRLAMISGNEPVSRDVPPFAAVRYGGLKAYNAVGVRRAGLPAASLLAIRTAYSLILRTRVTATAIAEIKEAGLDSVLEVAELLRFLTTAQRGIMPPAHFVYAATQGGGGEDSEGRAGSSDGIRPRMAGRA